MTLVLLNSRFFGALLWEMCYLFGTAKAYECNLSVVDHDIFMLHIIIGMPSFVYVLNNADQLTAYVQNCINLLPFVLRINVIMQRRLVLWHRVVCQ